MIQLIITRKCNFSCGHCMYCCDASGRHMSDAVFKASLPYIAKAGVHVMGGEPTLHPEFTTMIRAVAQHSKNTRLVTNGSAVKNENLRTTSGIYAASCLSGHGRFMVHISNDKWHRKFISKEDICKAEANLKRCGISVFADPMDNVTTYPLGRALNGSVMRYITKNSIDAQPAECTKGDYAPWDNLSIDVNGDVAPCPHHTCVVGNILRDSMQTIVQRAKKYIADVRAKAPSNRDCAGCSKL